LEINETQLIQSLAKSLEDGDSDKSRDLALETIKMKYNFSRVFNQGVVQPLKKMGNDFGSGDVFLTELFMAADAAKIAMDVLLPEMVKQEGETQLRGRIVIGTVIGDIHDLGKNLVGAVLRANGFEVIDLGIDVSTETFVKKVKDLKPNILAMSAMVTSTMPAQGEVIEALEKEGLRNRVRVIIGGASIDGAWTEMIGADAYGLDVNDAVKKCNELITK
jgi:methylmalonyl-CoA mutase cobalamin-binding domain/chain